MQYTITVCIFLHLCFWPHDAQMQVASSFISLCKKKEGNLGYCEHWDWTAVFCQLLQPRLRVWHSVDGSDTNYLCHIPSGNRGWKLNERGPSIRLVQWDCIPVTPASQREGMKSLRTVSNNHTLTVSQADGN